jgi:hypothetical protein
MARSIDKERKLRNVSGKGPGVVSVSKIGLANVYAIASRVVVGPSITLCLFVVAKSGCVSVD